MARTPAGLTDEQVGGLRTALQENRRPKVTVAGQQFGGETTGQVVTVGDPVTEGQEFIQVRVKLDGLTDVLRFAPTELRLPERAKAAVVPRSAALRAAGPGVDGTASLSSESDPSISDSSKPGRPKPVAAKAVPGATAAPPQLTATVPSTAPVAGRPAASTSTARSRRPAMRPPAVTITISSSGTDWILGVNRGGKSVVKAIQVAPGVVAAAAELLGENTLSAAVEEVNAVALRTARQRAEELRSELAALETLLAAHRAPGG